MSKAIFFNGPPRCGKDTSARAALEIPGVKFERFAMPIKTAFAGMMGRAVDDYGNVEFYEDRKEELVPELGVTYRQWQIDFSEKFMKPLYGQDVFARMLIGRTPAGSHLAISDSGFLCEVAPVARVFGPKNVLLVRIHRDGTDFSRDSRSYVDCPLIEAVDIENNDCQTTFEMRVRHMVSEFIFS